MWLCAPPVNPCVCPAPPPVDVIVVKPVPDTEESLPLVPGVPDEMPFDWQSIRAEMIKTKE